MVNTVKSHAIRPNIISAKKGRAPNSGLLSSWGMRPAEARDGATALEVLLRAVAEKDP